MNKIQYIDNIKPYELEIKSFKRSALTAEKAEDFNKAFLRATKELAQEISNFWKKFKKKPRLK